MKRLGTFACVLFLLTAILTVGTFAAETILYENDFSTPATLSDFAQYRLQWEIQNGGLYLTDEPTDTMPSSFTVDDNAQYAHILYQASELPTDYIVEADYMNVQTAGGLIFRADGKAADEQADGYYGYMAFIGAEGNRGAFGCSGWSGRYLGNFNTGKVTSACTPGTNAHIKVIVKGDKIKVDITNKDTGKAIYSYAYTIHRASNDAQWVEGTVGFRMLTSLTSLGLNSVDNAYFDNLRITTANEVTAAELTTVAKVDAAEAISSIDTSNVKTVYTNTFDDAAAIKDFTQYNGTWMVRDGKLYANTVIKKGYMHILYSGEESLTELPDYVVEFDMYNTQSASGGIIRGDLSRADHTSNGFYGYIAFVSTDATKAAFGYAAVNGSYGGNMAVSSTVTAPGANVHFKIAVKGDLVQCVVTDIDSGKELWRRVEKNVVWTEGTFGFRVLAKNMDGRNCLKNTAFDNLTVSVLE